jgi:acyl-coenzyme A thioesterase PaaI-like protein
VEIMSDRIAPCLGCRTAQTSCRFSVDDLRTDGPNTALAVLRCPSSFEGGPRIAHGGWTAAAFDCGLGRFVGFLGGGAVTATLTIDYRQPVPVEQDLIMRARIDSREDRRWMVSGSLQLARGREDLALASGLWVQRRPDHFERHEERLAAYLANDHVKS